MVQLRKCQCKYHPFVLILSLKQIFHWKSGGFYYRHREKGCHKSNCLSGTWKRSSSVSCSCMKNTMWERPLIFHSLRKRN